MTLTFQSWVFFEDEPVDVEVEATAFFERKDGTHTSYATSATIDHVTDPIGNSLNLSDHQTQTLIAEAIEVANSIQSKDPTD